MPPELNERFLAGSGSVSIRYFLSRSRIRDYLDILIIRYSGEYPCASDGNADAIYMHAMATAAVAAFHPSGVIHDLSELKYEWGDLLQMVLGVGPEHHSELGAIIVGPACEEAVRTLYLGEYSDEPLETLDWAFRDLDAALRYVDDKIGQ